jgi:hypothetical protein
MAETWSLPESFKVGVDLGIETECSLEIFFSKVIPNFKQVESRLRFQK